MVIVYSAHISDVTGLPPLVTSPGACEEICAQNGESQGLEGSFLVEKCSGVCEIVFRGTMDQQ